MVAEKGADGDAGMDAGDDGLAAVGGFASAGLAVAGWGGLGGRLWDMAFCWFLLLWAGGVVWAGNYKSLGAIAGA